MTARVISQQARDEAIRQYAEIYVRHAHVHETLDDYAEQVALDFKDDSVKHRLKAEVMQVQRRRKQYGN